MKHCLSCLIYNLKPRSLDKAIQELICLREFEEHGKRTCNVLGRFYFYFFYVFGGVFNRQLFYLGLLDTR